MENSHDDPRDRVMTHKVTHQVSQDFTSRHEFLRDLLSDSRDSKGPHEDECSSRAEKLYHTTPVGRRAGEQAEIWTTHLFISLSFFLSPISPPSHPLPNIPLRRSWPILWRSAGNRRKANFLCNKQRFSPTQARLREKLVVRLVWMCGCNCQPAMQRGKPNRGSKGSPPLLYASADMLRVLNR